jgi:phosphopantetheinyl transferase
MSILQIYTSPLRGIWKIIETLPELIDLFNPENSEEDRVRMIHVKSETRKMEYVSVRLLLKHLLGKEVRILYNSDGSPYLINSDYHISISHTKGYAAVILSEESNPGIDIEYRSERVFALKERFLSKDELDLINAEKLISPVDFATLLWCAKETAFKSLKCENVDFIDHLNIFTCSMRKNAGTLIIKETKTDQRQSFAIDFEITDDYVLAWKG